MITCLLAAPAAFAQTPEKAELSTTPVAPAGTEQSAPEPVTPQAPSTDLKLKPKFSYNLNLGASFSNYGSASYVQPRLNYQVSDRFRFYTSLTALNINSNYGRYNESSNPFGTQHYIMEVGGDYLVNEKLIVGGSVWRDFNNFSTFSGDNNLQRQFKPASGFDVNAHYKINDNFSVSGRIRYSNGNSPVYMMQNPYIPGGF